MDLVLNIVFLLTELFLLLLGMGVLTVIALYVVDRTQTRHSLRRNFPVLARFRYLFEKLGGFADSTFLQWIANCHLTAPNVVGPRAAKGADTTVAFGSTEISNGPVLVFKRAPDEARCSASQTLIIGYNFKPILFGIFGCVW